MSLRLGKAITLVLMALGIALILVIPQRFAQGDSDHEMDRRLAAALQQAGFTGRIEATLRTRLGRPVDRRLADLGRLLFFDNALGLHNDNSCAGCHTPAFSFGDSQAIAIGVDNNGFVGPNRIGPRNQRKAPPVTNSAFFPKLMWNGRFFAPSGDPFDNSQGFQFPLPEGTMRFPPNDPNVRHLLAAQGHIPQTELVEMAGFTGTRGTLEPAFDPFDGGHGVPLPPADASGFRNEPIRTVVLARINTIPEYRRLFGRIFNRGHSFPEGGITFAMIGQALAEFQISLTFANAPIDRDLLAVLAEYGGEKGRLGALFHEHTTYIRHLEQTLATRPPAASAEEHRRLIRELEGSLAQHRARLDALEAGGTKQILRRLARALHISKVLRS